MPQKDVIRAAKRGEPYSRPNESLSVCYGYYSESMIIKSYALPIARVRSATRIELLTIKNVSPTTAKHIALLKKHFDY